MGILTKNVHDVDVLKLFDNGISIDTKLPKWVNAAKRLEAKNGKKSKNQDRNYGNYGIDLPTDADAGVPGFVDNSNFVVYGTPEPYEIKETVSFDEVAAANLKELTDIIKAGELNNVLSGYGGMHGWGNQKSTPFAVEASGPMPVYTPKTIGGFIKGAIKNVSRFVNEWLNKPEIDAIKFFTFVKLTTKESAITYRDRVSKYLQAIHNANMVGQTALVEKLLSEMIANKYESLLFSTGKYHVITEEQMVQFAKKSERAINLCYVKNYARPIPNNVIEVIANANELEVFDNYVILYYDTTGTVQKETKKEEAKRRDPILFGVIAGSHKLYYLADWIDEYCDLTLEKFVDTIGVKKEDLLEGGPLEEKKETNKEVKKEETKKKATVIKKTTSKK